MSINYNYEEEIFKVKKLKADNYYIFQNVRNYKYGNKEYKYINENLKYMGIDNRKLPIISDNIYDKINDSGTYIWDVKNYDTVILPTLNKHFYEDNYYIDENKTAELPGFFFVSYIDEPTFKKIEVSMSIDNIQKLIDENNNIIQEINKKLEKNRIFEPFDIIYMDGYETNIEKINEKYDDIVKKIKNISEDVQKMIKYTYRIDCKTIVCKDNKMDYLKNNLLTRNYHKGLSSKYSEKLLDTYSKISTNILLEYKKLLTGKIYEILNINDSDIIDIELNTNEDFIEEIINKLFNNKPIKLKYYIEEELKELNELKINKNNIELFLFIIKNIDYHILLNKLDIDIDKIPTEFEDIDILKSSIINILNLNIDDLDHQKLYLVYYIIKNKLIDETNSIFNIESIDKLLLVTFVIKNLPNKDILQNRQINRLQSQIARTCKNVNNTSSHQKYAYKIIKDGYLKKDILLEEIFNDPNKKQLLYMSSTYMNYYRKNDLITQEPFNERSLNMSVISWNNLINKALTNCWVENSDHTFPLRLILHNQSGFSHIQSYYNDMNNNERLRFVGFFLAKFDEKTNGLIDMTKIRNKECRRYYDFTDTFKPKKSNYYIMFVFSSYIKNMPTRYSLFNFKCNEIYFGSTHAFKRILYTSEIRQLVSMNIQNKAYYYLLLEKENDIEKLTKYEDLNNICTTLLKNEPNKKSFSDCIEANLEPYFLNKLLNLGYYPYSTKNNYINKEGNTKYVDEQHIFISKLNFNAILQHLQKKNINVLLKNYTIIDTLLRKIKNIQDWKINNIIELKTFIESNKNINLKKNSISISIQELKIIIESNKNINLKTKKELINIIDSYIKKELKTFIESNENIKFKKYFITIINNSNSIKELFYTLNKYNIKEYIEFNVNGKNYGLFQCHFDWSSDFKYIDQINILKESLKTEFLKFKNKINFYDKNKYSDEELQIIQKYEDLISELYINDKFFIRDGDMTDQRKKYLLSDLIYIKDLCTFSIDIFRDIIPYLNIYTPEQNDLYKLFLNNSEFYRKTDKQNLENNINIEY